MDYEPLPAVPSIEAALADESLLFPDAGTNVCVRGGRPIGDDSIFAGCEVIVEGDVVNQRVAALPMEGRATAAVFKDGKLTVWTSTQNAQLARLILTAIGLPPDAIRVVAPDVGGGFGAKIGVDREQIIVAWAAKHTGRPVRWVETRNENLMAMTQGRAQLHHIKLGGDREGHIKAYRLDVVQDSGAYSRMGGFLPMLTNLMAPGVYDIPAVEADYKAVVTNGTPIAAYRGAGRPEAAATIERAVDWYAAEAGVDPALVRRLNFIQKDQFPFVTKTGAPYDTGDYEAALDKVLAAAGYNELRAEQQRRSDAGETRLLGIGLASYVEITAADGAAGETAKVEVHDDGTATVYTGSSAHGQGHHTAYAMIVTDELGIPMDKIEVIHGDTDLIPDGVGTYASRSLQLGGSAVHKAAIEVKDEAAKKAAELFEAAEADVVLDAETGIWHIDGDPDKALSWSQVAVGGRRRADRRQRAVHRRPADVPVRHASLARRGRRGDRQGHAAPARHRRRRGPGAQPDPVRGPAARRHRPGRRAGARRGDPLRQRRQPADRHADGLRRDHRGRAAQLRAADQRDARPR